MSIQIYSTALFVGEVDTEYGEVGWISDGNNSRIGRVEIDWGDDRNADHLAYVYRGDECIANISLDRYLPNTGQIFRRDSMIGEVRLESAGNCSIYRGSKKVGSVKFSGKGGNDKHLILMGGGGAIVLLGI